MNPILITLATLACFSVSCSIAQSYGNEYASSRSYGNQRKLAPVPQSYAPAASQQYGQQAAPKAYAAPVSAPVQYNAKPVAYAAKPHYEEPYHPPSPFAWGYDINDGYGGAQYHKETGDEYGKRTGSYGYTDAYGIYRQVDYVADEHGFRATIKSNEPGVDDKPSSPADVDLHHYEPPTNHYASNEYAAPAAQKAYAPAPVATPAYKPAYKQSAYQSPKSYQAAPQSSYSSNHASNSYEQSSAYSSAASALAPQYQQPIALPYNNNNNNNRKQHLSAIRQPY